MVEEREALRHYSLRSKTYEPCHEKTNVPNVAKTKAPISFAVTAKLIYVFVFAYAKCWFSHDAACIYTNNK